MKFEVISANSVVIAIANGTAPRPVRLAAAKGVLPLPQEDLLEALVFLASCEDKEVVESAIATLATQEDNALLPVITSEDAAPAILDYFATRRTSSHAVNEAIILNLSTPGKSIVEFARLTRNTDLLELISFNQQLLIKNPEIIDVILENPNRNAEAERRVTETRREFFEKERGAEQIVRELRAQGNEAAAEFIEQADFAEDLSYDSDTNKISLEDAILLAEHIEVPDAEVDDSWLSLEYIEEIYEETDAERKANVEKILGELMAEDDELSSERVSMISRIMNMSIRDRMRLAIKGDREARTILIRDPNRLISAAVVQNPKITDQEVEKIANMRTVNQDVLRLIAINRKWTRSYKVIHMLILNPRTPLSNVMSMLPRLQLKDLRSLATNKNVSEAVRKQGQRIVSARTGK